MTFVSRVIAPMFFVGCLSDGTPAAAAQLTARSPTEEKCGRYKDAWPDYVGRTGALGLGENFITAHQAFIGSGCLQERSVCPSSSQEFSAANAMTIRALTAGAASTFLPFACGR